MSSAAEPCQAERMPAEAPGYAGPVGVGVRPLAPAVLWWAPMDALVNELRDPPDQITAARAVTCTTVARADPRTRPATTAPRPRDTFCTHYAVPEFGHGF